MPATTVAPTSPASRRQPVDVRTVQRLGHRTEREVGRPEVVHGRLGKHHQALVVDRAAPSKAPRTSADAVSRLLLDVQRRRELDERDQHRRQSASATRVLDATMA